MRVDILFVVFVGAPVIATGLALAPLDFEFGAEPQAEKAPAPAPDPAPTDWIAPFASKLIVAEQQQAVTVQRDPLEGFRLVGLVEGDDGLWAMITGGGEVRTLAQGDRLAGYELVRFDESRAVFQRGEDERSLSLPR